MAVFECLCYWSQQQKILFWLSSIEENSEISHWSQNWPLRYRILDRSKWRHLVVNGHRIFLLKEGRVPDMPTRFLSLSNKILRLIVSKAALKSSSTSIQHMPASLLIKMSLVNLRKPVSVLWCWRTPDWKVSNMLFFHCSNELLSHNLKVNLK